MKQSIQLQKFENKDMKVKWCPERLVCQKLDGKGSSKAERIFKRQNIKVIVRSDNEANIREICLIGV